MKRSFKFIILAILALNLSLTYAFAETQEEEVNGDKGNLYFALLELGLGPNETRYLDVFEQKGKVNMFNKNKQPQSNITNAEKMHQSHVSFIKFLLFEEVLTPKNLLKAYNEFLLKYQPYKQHDLATLSFKNHIHDVFGNSGINSQMNKITFKHNDYEYFIKNFLNYEDFDVRSATQFLTILLSQKIQNGLCDKKSSEYSEVDVYQIFCNLGFLNRIYPNLKFQEFDSVWIFGENRGEYVLSIKGFYDYFFDYKKLKNFTYKDVVIFTNDRILSVETESLWDNKAKKLDYRESKQFIASLAKKNNISILVDDPFIRTVDPETKRAVTYFDGDRELNLYDASCDLCFKIVGNCSKFRYNIENYNADGLEYLIKAKDNPYIEEELNNLCRFKQNPVIMLSYNQPNARVVKAKIDNIIQKINRSKVDKCSPVIHVLSLAQGNEEKIYNAYYYKKHASAVFMFVMQKAMNNGYKIDEDIKIHDSYRFTNFYSTDMNREIF